MKVIFLFLVILVFLASGCVWDAPLLTPSEFCENQGGFVVTGPYLEGQTDFCLLPDQSYCRAKDFQDGFCARGKSFYKCSLVGSLSEGYYDRDTFTLISFAQCGAMSLANPASVYCQEQGGAVIIRNDPRPEGGQYGVCMLDNGTECDEWAFYKGGCDSCLTFCIKNFNETCPGHWGTLGEYPDCNCLWLCD